MRGNRPPPHPPVNYDLRVFRDSPDLQDIVARSIDVNPKRRYDKTSDMLKELQQMMQQVAGEEIDEHDAPTRATIADPALIERRRAHQAAQPVFIPPKEMETMLESPSAEQVQERPDWMEEDDGLAPEADLMEASPSGTSAPPGTSPSVPGAYSSQSDWMQAQIAQLDFVAETGEVLAALPETIENETALGAAESVAARFEALQVREWASIPEEQKTAAFAEIKERLGGLIKGYVESERDAVVARFAADEDAAAAASNFASMAKRAPTLAALVPAEFDAAQSAITQAQARYTALQMVASTLNRLRGAVPKTISSAQELALAESASEEEALTAMGFKAPELVALLDDHHAQAVLRVKQARVQAAGEDPARPDGSGCRDRRRRRFLENSKAYIEGLKQAATERYANLDVPIEQDDAVRDAQVKLESDAPALVELVQRTYQGALQTVESARGQKVALLAEREEVQKRAAEMQAQQAALAQLRQQEEAALQEVRDTVVRVCQAWEDDPDADLSAEYTKILSASFETDELKRAFEALRDEFAGELKNRLGSYLTQAEGAIAGFRSHVYQVFDPMLSGSYRLYDETTVPEIAFSLPPEDDVGQMELGISRWQVLRLRLWAKAGRTLDDPNVVSTLAKEAESWMKKNAESYSNGFQRIQKQIDLLRELLSEQGEDSF